MMERNGWSWLVQALLWIGVGLLPVVVWGLWEALSAAVADMLQGRVHWFSLMFAVQLLCGGALLVLTGLHLLHAGTPRWLWIVATVLLGVATAAMAPELAQAVQTELPDAGVSLGVALLTPGVSAAMLALNGAWSALQREEDAV